VARADARWIGGADRRAVEADVPLDAAGKALVSPLHSIAQDGGERREKPAETDGSARGRRGRRHKHAPQGRGQGRSACAASLLVTPASSRTGTGSRAAGVPIPRRAPIRPSQPGRAQGRIGPALIAACARGVCAGGMADARGNATLSTRRAGPAVRSPTGSRAKTPVHAHGGTGSRTPGTIRRGSESSIMVVRLVSPARRAARSPTCGPACRPAATVRVRPRPRAHRVPPGMAPHCPREACRACRILPANRRAAPAPRSAAEASRFGAAEREKALWNEAAAPFAMGAAADAGKRRPGTPKGTRASPESELTGRGRSGRPPGGSAGGSRPVIATEARRPPPPI